MTIMLELPKKLAPIHEEILRGSRFLDIIWTTLNKGLQTGAIQCTFVSVGEPVPTEDLFYHSMTRVICAMTTALNLTDDEVPASVTQVFMVLDEASKKFTGRELDEYEKKACFYLIEKSGLFKISDDFGEDDNGIRQTALAAKIHKEVLARALKAKKEGDKKDGDA